jgi:hypothetical protein
MITGCATLFPPTESAPAGQEQAEGQDEGDNREQRAPTWREIANGDQSAVRVPVAQTVADLDTWIDAWSAIHANKSQPPQRPTVTLDQETVVLILLGQRPTGGYGVAVTSIDTGTEPVEITVEVTSPAADAMVTQALTSPYLIIGIPGPGRSIVLTGDDIAAGYQGE